VTEAVPVPVPVPVTVEDTELVLELVHDGVLELVHEDVPELVKDGVTETDGVPDGEACALTWRMSPRTKTKAIRKRMVLFMWNFFL